jgi:CBS domain-containing protein
MQVRDLMTADVVSVLLDDTLSVAARRLWEHDCGALPVLEGSGRVVGMITDRDICMATWTRGTAPDLLSVKHAMSTKLVACSPDDVIEDAQAAMRSSQVRRLPVLDAEQQLVGIISLSDIARNAAAADDPQPNDERNRGIVSTLAVIGQPLRIPIVSAGAPRG